MSSTSVCASINQVLRQCMPCPAAPPTRNWVLMDRVSESRSQPGMTIDVKTSAKARDSLGRIAHVRGILIRCKATLVCADGSAAVTAHQLRSLIGNLYMTDVTGHSFWPSLDGRDILDDNFFRHWMQITWPGMTAGTQTGANAPYAPTKTADYGLAADINATTTREISLYCPLATLNNGGNPLAGLVPLGALQRQSSQGALRFKLMSEIAGSPNGVEFTGVINGEGNPGLDVWFDMVYLPALVADPAWVLDSYTLPDSKTLARLPGSSTEHLWVRFHEEDDFDATTPGFAACQDLDQITLTVAGDTLMPGMSFLDAVSRQQFFYTSERDGALARFNAANDLPLFTEQGVGALCLLPYRQKGFGEASGDIEIKFGTMGPLTNVRYLQRTVACNEEERAQQLAEVLECDPCSKTVATDNKGNPTKVGTQKSTLLVLDPLSRG